MAFDKNSEIFVMHIKVLETIEIIIYSAQET